MNLTPHHIIISKIINRLTSERNKLWRFLPVKSIINRRTKKLTKNTDSDYLKKQLVRILGDFKDFSSININNYDKKEIISLANQTLEHKFDYLGSGPVKIDPIDWHTDFKSGFTWDKGRFYKRYITTDLSNDSDVKIPWELSRNHHLLWLGEAYLLTKDEKYAKEIVYQINHWIVENPLMYSINWTCAMDVAIRAVNWLYAANMIIDSQSIDNSFAKTITASLYEHGWFIYNNLEKGFPYSANHYASDITGLLFISQFFIENSFGSKWWKFALNEYFTEIREQVFPSGVHFERSVSYHRLMTEMFFYPYLLLKRVNENIPSDIHHRLKTMFDFTAHYTKPNGLAPMIGDDDNGRLLPFTKGVLNDHRYLLGVYSHLDYNPVFNDFKNHSVIDSFFLYAGLEKNRKEESNTKNVLFSKAYVDAGFVILRSKDVQLFFNNSGLSRYPDSSRKFNGSHTHADLLSFELSIGKHDLIIDPGSYIYTALPKERNDFRSTDKHNTIVIDDMNQYEFSPLGMFIMGGDIQSQKVKHQVFNDLEVCTGSYRKKIKENLHLNHKREIEVSSISEEIIINDYIDYPGSHKLSMFFHLAPNVEAIMEQNDVQFYIDSNYISTMYLPQVEDSELKIIKDTISTSYGTKENSKTIRFVCRFDSEINLKTVIK